MSPTQRNEIMLATEFRNLLAKLIRSGEIARTAEYEALNNAIHEAMAKPAVIARTIWDLPVARACFEADRKPHT